MIEPTKITDYNRNYETLFEFAVFAVCVAGKNSDQTAKKVHDLLSDSYFQKVLRIQIENYPKNDQDFNGCILVIKFFLQKYKIGQYNRLARVIFFLNQKRPVLNKILFNELVIIKGIGPKTAAFFLLHSRQGFKVPVIDTHICKYMATKGISMKITSNLEKYLTNCELVSTFIKMDFPTLTLAQADLLLWTRFSGREV